MAGTANRIESNVHDAALDPAGRYNLVGDPFIWLSTYGGNTNRDVCGYHNHSAYNQINCNVSPRPGVFIQQLDDPLWAECENTKNLPLKGDRSVQCNQALLGSQRFFLRARSSTRYPAPNLQVSGQNVLMPDNAELYLYCADCSRNRL